MKPKTLNFIWLGTLLLLMSVASAETNLNFQGQLSQAGQAANGQYDMIFIVYDAVTGGNQQATPITETDIEVTGGIFNVLLDFGDAAFNSDPRWLEIFVREAGIGNYTELTPRQRIGAAPFAIESLYLGPDAVDTLAIQEDAVTRAKIANDAIGTTQIENNTVTSADIRDGTVTAIDVAGGLYSNKSALYEVFSPLASVGLGPQNQNAACQDTNDLPIWGGCRSEFPNVFIALRGEQIDWSNSANPAAVNCHAVNVHPSSPSSNPYRYQAHMICLAVD